ncbi:MAG: hypothetical protein KAT05_07735 [Spirochaetes bacterium]|nr:hypothetical protein [Spirochaetota bacterium]
MAEQLKTSQKVVKLHIYQYRLSGTDNTTSNLKDIFNIETITNNIIKYYVHFSLLLVFDRIDGDFLFGRFLKLRKDTPSILNRLSGSERNIELSIEEDIEEISHFICNVNDNIIIAEYNFQAIRHFSAPLKYYLDKIFDANDNLILPVEDKDTSTKFKKTPKGIKSFRIRVAQYKIKELEQSLKLSPLSTLLDLSKNNNTMYDIKVIKSRKKDEFLDRHEVLKTVENLNGDGGIYTLEAETTDCVYDLINNNLIRYHITLDDGGRRINSEEFYEKVKELYLKYIRDIKESLRPI